MRAAFATLIAALFLAAPAQAAPEDFGLELVDASLSNTQAGAHPDLSLDFEITQDPESPPNVFGLHAPNAAPRDIEVELPPGLIGDPNVLGRSQQCTVTELLAWNAGGGCPNGSQVGLVRVSLYGLTLRFTEPMYMMVPPGGDAVARLGFIAGVYPTFVDFEVRSEGDYGLTAKVSGASPNGEFVGVEQTAWGVPADPAHDNRRCTPKEVFNGCVTSPPRPPGSRPLPFLTNPTRCGAQLEVRVNVTAWLPGLSDSAADGIGPIVGCDRVPFGAALELEPTNRRAGAPTGLDATLTIPEADGVDVLAGSHMRNARVVLPEGMTIAPGAADGLEGCSAAQVRLGERRDAECPAAAKIGSFVADVPALERPLQGGIYQRTPRSDDLFGIWLVADDLGAHVKLEGEVELDPSTGQIESLFLDNPQVPVREFRLHFKGGDRAPLANPPTCGAHLAHWEFEPWSGGPPAAGDAPIRIDEGCGAGGFAPGFSAGPLSPLAGQPSPFITDITRADTEQNIAGLSVTLPPGALAKLAGVALCPEPGASLGSCPAASRIGSTTVATGPGPAPLWVPQPGKDPTAVYLAGPYKGAPLSLVVVTPAQAGPFDLGVVVTRAALRLDPVSAQVTVEADPLPQFLEGVPLFYRHIHVAIDRPDFTRNPTSCEATAALARILSDRGALAGPLAPIGIGGCRGLGFRPRLGLRLRGGTRRGAFPALRVVYSPRPGDANLRKLSLRFPRSAFIEQGHFRTICTRVQFAAGAGHGAACPPGAVYGRARVFTPLLEEPLAGPVILRSSDHNLPDAVLVLRGPDRLPIEIEAAVRIDSAKGGLRAILAEGPDAPIAKVIVDMQGGQKGLIVNSRDICRATNRATVKLDAHNNRRAGLRPKVRASCGKKRGRGRGR